MDVDGEQPEAGGLTSCLAVRVALQRRVDRVLLAPQPRPHAALVVDAKRRVDQARQLLVRGDVEIGLRARGPSAGPQ